MTTTTRTRELYAVAGDNWLGWRIVTYPSGKTIRLGYRNRATAHLVAQLMDAGRIGPEPERENGS